MLIYIFLAYLKNEITYQIPAVLLYLGSDVGGDPDHFIENDPGEADRTAWAARVGLCSTGEFSRLKTDGSYECVSCSRTALMSFSCKSSCVRKISLIREALAPRDILSA